MENNEENSFIEPVVIDLVPSSRTGIPIEEEKKEEVKPVIEKVKTPEEIKKTRTIYAITSSIIIVVALVVYFVFFYEFTPSVNMKKASSVVEFFANAVSEKKYSESIKYVYLPEDSFIYFKDYQIYVNNNNFYNELSNNKVKKIEKVSNEEYAIVLDNGNKLNVKVTKDKNGEYKVIQNDLYISNWSFEVPGESDVFIDESLVSKKLINSNNKGHDVYVLPAIASGTKKFKISNELGSFLDDVNIAGSNNGQILEVKLDNEELVNNALNYIKESYNNIIDLYSKGESYSSYFASETDLNSSLDKLTKKGNVQSVFTNIKISNIKLDDSKVNTVEGKNLIKIYFGYEVKFTVDFVDKIATDWNKNMTRYSSIVLQKDNDSFKIFDVSDPKLFSELNYTIHEY